jgi:hypothetical protein
MRHPSVLQDLLEVGLLTDSEEAFFTIPGDMHAEKVSCGPKISQVKALLEFCFEVIEVDTAV